MSLPEFVAEVKVAEQGPDGREMALDPDPRRQDLHGVADPDRSVDGDHGAVRTTASDESGLERQDVAGADHLADVRTRFALTVHTQREPADAKLALRCEEADAGQPKGRDLLAQVAGPETERLEHGAVDDHDGAPGAMRVRVALDAAANATGDLADRARVLAVALVQMQADDACVHGIEVSGLRTTA